MLFTLAMPVIMEIDFILGIWLGEVPANTVLLSQLFLAMLLIEVFYLNLNYAIHSTGKIKMASVISGTLYILIPVISYIVLKLGARQVYLPMLIAILVYIVEVVARLFIAKKLIPQLSVPNYCKNVLALSVFTAAVGSVFPFFVHFCMDEGWLRLIFTCAASAVSMAIATYYLALGKTMRENLKTTVLTKLHLNRK